MTSDHLHLFLQYPPRHPSHFVACKNPGPRLEVGDVLDHEGRLYTALPEFNGPMLVVRRDPAGAQIATESIPEMVDQHDDAKTQVPA